MSYIFFIFKASVSSDQSVVSVQATARNTSQNATISMAPSLVIGISNRNKGKMRATPSGTSVCPLEGASGMSVCPLKGGTEQLWREVAEPVMKVKVEAKEVEVENVIDQDSSKEEEVHIKGGTNERMQKMRPRAGTLMDKRRENKEVVDLIPSAGTSKYSLKCCLHLLFKN